jgi:uncharacterized protein (DUF2252 family)
MLERQAATLVSELTGIRYGRMLRSPFSFYRGAAAVMAADLATTPTSGLEVQLCGDAHVANFGGFASAERSLVFDINDFDETSKGPWEWDLKRLAASLEIVGRELGISNKKRRKLVRSAAGEYQSAMHRFAGLGYMAVWYSQLDVAGISERWADKVKSRTLQRLERAKSRARDSRHAYQRLTETRGGRVRFVSDPPLVERLEDLAEGEDAAVLDEDIRDSLVAYAESLADDRRQILARFTYGDAARRVVGIGSVGRRTNVVLLLSRDSSEPLVLQVKEAVDSVLEPYAGKSHYAHHGRRVVEGQRLMQASNDILLGWTRHRGGYGVVHDYYVRQMWDWKVAPELEGMRFGDLRLLGRACAWTLARAHARSGDRIAISAYLGTSARFADAIDDFAIAYAEQNQTDYEGLIAAAERGRIFARADA